MSFANNASRFDFLPDDAGDPFETASKKNKKKSGSGGGSNDSKKKAGAKNSSNSDRKQLQSLAFGSASEGKKKSKSTTQTQQSQQNGNCSVANTSSSSKEINPDGNVSEETKVQRNGNSSEKNANLRPKGMSKEQWDEWQKRDADIMDETYATELQTALLQSQLEYESEQRNKPAGKGKKKKPVAVPLTEFNARLGETGLSTITPGGAINGSLPSSSLGDQSYVPPTLTEADEELVERFRMEARLELERERQKAIQRQLLMSRQPPPPIARPTPISSSTGSVTVTSNVVGDEKDLIISQLTDENIRLKSDISLLKERVKTINNYLQAAQEVKDKAKLIYELDSMTKANNDLNEELRQTQTQLEQERSRSTAAMSELRRLLETRRRTATEGSNS